MTSFYTLYYIRENILATSSLEAGEMDELAETFNSIFLNQFSADCALLSGGGVLTVLDSVMAESRAGIAVVRPPGHHAEEVPNTYLPTCLIPTSLKICSLTPEILNACQFSDFSQCCPYEIFNMNNYTVI